jgi:hypothetical protein
MAGRAIPLTGEVVVSFPSENGLQAEQIEARIDQEAEISNESISLWGSRVGSSGISGHSIRKSIIS